MLLPENIRLRPIREDDMPLLRRIYASTRESELAQVDWAAAQKEAFLSSQFELQHRYYQTHFPQAEFRIIEYLGNDGAQDIGRWYVDQQGHELRLIDIALLPEWRNRGIGSGLLNGLIAMADRLQKEIVLHVEVNSPALSLYLRMGFETRADNGVYSRLMRSPQPLAA